jgi:phosphoribosyl 1,2-cyclic phosphodiesterase
MQTGLMSDSTVTIHSLASGSSANAVLLRYRGVTLLVDCGLPIRKLRTALHPLGLRPEEIDILFVTHEHADHVRSLPQLGRLGATIITSRGTARALGLGASEYIGALPGKAHSYAGFDLHPLAVSHDSAEALGLHLVLGSTQLTILTDLGCVTHELIEAMSSSDLIVIEANHDVEMLRLGPYPIHLKRRVMSDRGHLSNIDAGLALRSVCARRTEMPSVWLAHLSVTNNRPLTALATVRQHIPGVQVAPLPRHDVVDLNAKPPTPASGEILVQPSLWFDR